MYEDLTLSALLPLVIFAFSTAVSPGPNNILVLAISMQQGWRKCVPVIIGMSTGFLVLLAISATGVGAALAASDTLYNILKFVAAAYLLYLAFLLIKSGRNSLDIKEEVQVSMFRAVALQFVNPKAWVMALTVIAAFSKPDDSYIASTLIIAVVFTVINLISNSIWAFLGLLVRSAVDDPKTIQTINITMGILLAISVIMIFI